MGAGLGCWARGAQAGVCGRAGRHGAGRAGGRCGRVAGRVRHAGRSAGARTAGNGARGVRSRGAGRTAWARGLAKGYALGALSLFLARFDLVFFLSQFLDIVREPGS